MVRSPVVLALLLLVAVAAVAEPPVPVVDSISPGEGPVTGGTRVTLRGRNFDGGPCQNEQGCALAVKFYTPHPVAGWATGVGKLISATDTEIVIETPEHGNGLVDVIVWSASGGRTVVPNGFRFGRGGFRRILVPLAFRGFVQGAFDSVWVTELTGRVFDKYKSEVTRKPFSTPALPVQGPFVFDDFPQGHTGGIFIYVPESDYLDMSLRIRDVSRERENFGTEVPLVSAEETTPYWAQLLLDIPIDPKYRQTLRIYNFEGKRAATVSFRIHARDSVEDLAFVSIHLPNFPIEEFPTEPGYLQISLADWLPAGYTGRVDVYVWAAPGPRIWSMVSVTNNETQMVTMVTPADGPRGPVPIIH